MCSCFCFCLFVVVFCCCCIILILMTHVLVNNEIAYIILKKRLEGPQLRLFTYMYLKCCCARIIYIYMIDLDRRPVSNRRPLFKSASTDVIISNHGPILGYSQIGVLYKLSYLLSRLNDITLPSKIIVTTVFFLICYFACSCCCVYFKHFPILKYYQ